MTHKYPDYDVVLPEGKGKIWPDKGVEMQTGLDQLHYQSLDKPDPNQTPGSAINSKGGH